LKWGVGGINIDGCRVGTEDNLNGGGYSKNFQGSSFLAYGGKLEYQQPIGRFPANLILSFAENEYIIKDNITNEQKQKALKWIYENA